MSITLGDAVLHLKSDDSELGRGLQAAERDFHNWWSGLQTMAVGAVTGLVATGVAITRKAVMQTQEYATEVRRMSSITGAGAEATSRMVQVFADFEIRGNALTVMLRTLASQGLSPTIETIAMLSDRYLALAPGVERATFLQDNFGRSGADLALVMDQGGAALLERNARIESGLVLSQAQLDRAEELRQSEDNLNDAWRAATTTLATAVTPALTTFIQQLGNALTPAHELERVWRLINLGTAEAAPTWREYVTAATDAAIANGNIALSARDYYIQGQLNNSLTQLEQETLGAYIETQYRAIHVEAQLGDERREGILALRQTRMAIEAIPTERHTTFYVDADISPEADFFMRHFGSYIPGAATLGRIMGQTYGGAAVPTGGAGGGPPGGWAAWEAAHPGEYWSGQHGLGFDVEGPSGTDQVPVNLALSRGEHVEVTPAGEGGGRVVNNYWNITVQNRDDLQALENQIAQIFRGV